MSEPKTYAYIDYYNLMHRNAHMSGKMSDIEEKTGMMIHSMLTAISYLKTQLKVDHVIICSDKSSWRKKVYPEYKLNRVTKRLKKSIREQEDDQKIFEAATDLFEFLSKQTRLPCVMVHGAEADDIIATHILDKPHDHHIIVSTDSDFYQLVNERVFIFNPTEKLYITIHGYFNEKFEKVIDKSGNHRHLGDPEWHLFQKCIRGDSSDNIKTSYPRVRTKGTKNKVGLTEAFEDRHNQTYAWLAIMEHEWEDGFGNKHLVRDLYQRNKHLIDLRNTPEDIKNLIREATEEQFNKREYMQGEKVGFAFAKFCYKWTLTALFERSSSFQDVI